MRKETKASTRRKWVPFLCAAALLCSAWLPFSAFAAGEVVQTENVNHVRSEETVMSAQPEGGKFSADKAADGKDDSGDHHDSRWSSGDALPAKDDKTYLQAKFAKSTRLSYFKVVFETRAEAAPPTPSNVKSFDLQYQASDGGAWQTARAFSHTETVAGGGYEAVVKIKLDAPIEATAVRLTNFDVLQGSTEWNGVSVAEFEAYTNAQADATDAPDVNYVKGAQMSASGQEGDLGAAKAADGDRGPKSRWSSGESAPAKDANTWLQAELKEPSKIQFVDIEFESRNVDVKPSNVKGFDIQYQAPGSTEWKTAKTVENAASGSGFEPRVRVTLDQPIVAQKLRLTNFDVVKGDTQWNGVSVVELEAYTNVQTVKESLDGVVKKLNKLGKQTVEKDVVALEAPVVPEGFSVELNGADFEQVIGEKGDIHHPLTDKVVQVSWKVRKDGTDEEAVTDDIPYEVKGVKGQDGKGNTKPAVVPEIQEWFSDSTVRTAFDKLGRVTYGDAKLKPVVDEFVADYKDFTGVELTAAQGAAQAGAFNFTLGEPAGDKLLGDEGYTMEIKGDRIDVTAPAVTGNMYAMQTILQMTKTETDGFPIGQMRDYPRFPVRGFMWDVARKPISLEMVGKASRTMRYYKMNDLQLHLSDNLIFLENYGEEKNQWQAYSAFRLESSMSNNGVSPTAKDYNISKDDMRSFIQSQRDLGMNIIPEIDMPAHAVAFTRAWPDLAVHGTRVTTAGNTTRSAIDHLDVRKPEARKLIRDIFDDYTTGANPVFDVDTVVHVGADEFIIPNGRPSYCEFYNDLVPHLMDSGRTPRIWGSFDSGWLAGGGVEPVSGEGVQMDIWSLGWANPKRMFDKGFSLINILDKYGYMVPNGKGKGNRGQYGDYLDTKGLYKSFDPNNFGGTVLPSSDPRILGSAYAIWNDNIDTNASGLSEADEYARFFDALPVYAENNWAPTGQEKGAGDAGFENLCRVVEKTGDAPRVNPYSKASKTGDTYAEYEFEGNLADASKNGRNLTAGTGATVENGKLQLAGGASYVEGPLDKIATGTSLSFDIELTRPARPGDILFEADAPYGTLDIRVMDSGKLGFTRELYTYYFDYKLPVGKKVNVEIVTSSQKTALKIDGEMIGTATGSFYNEYAGRVTKDGIENATLTLPLQRIGSKTQGIAAKIDNVRVASKPVDQFNKKDWTGRTNSETLKGEGNGGHLKHAFDGDVSTIWHSNWNKGTFTDQNVNGSLTETKMIWAEIDFGKAYEINQFSFTPRSDVESGRITKATLKVKATKDGAYETIATDQAFANDGKKKTFTFDTQSVYGVRLEVTDANSHGGSKYIAVSEFDIANKPVVPPTPEPPVPDPNPNPEPPAPQPEPEPQPGPQPEPPAPQPQPEAGPEQKPGASQSQSGKKPGDKLVATGDASILMVGASLLGGMGLMAAGVSRRRR